MAENPTLPGSETTMLSPRIIIEAGPYYYNVFREKLDILKTSVCEAAEQGYSVLQSESGTAVDAVEKAVCYLENNKYFNAGYGSLLNNDGDIECDAMIMNGHTTDSGAVVGVCHFKNPVSLARKVMEKSHHCILSGNGALAFAERINFESCDPEDLKDDETSKKLINCYKDFDKIVDLQLGGRPVSENSWLNNEQFDTIAAVAMDKKGHFACATSTGGIPGRLKGRVSDAPLVGCGGYANEYGAAATGGFGEAVIKMTLARQVVFNMEIGQNAQESADNAVKRMEQRLSKGYGSAIAIDKNGNFGRATSSASTLWATVNDDALRSGYETKRTFLFKN